jgi:hypothetical protein
VRPKTSNVRLDWSGSEIRKGFCKFNRGARTDASTGKLDKLKEVAVFSVDNRYCISKFYL